ncbi:zinc ribbon domain-containing protein [Chitinispirillales bacterium ANBcel5]|uniref:FmdB family zinc ribbon protein n=1 Tax=Cellulosispirillum alkaliphilum TaxID=3039283 RepID=UPI002A52D4CB|nr:zinc ribbon domain-containing protein [Chitinispirillales bacterium ANBcel5]
MPMYEFFCEQCNTIFTFFSRSVNPQTTPACPKNNSHQLKRMISMFSFNPKGQNADNPDNQNTISPQIDESMMVQAVESIASEAEHISEDDPREAAHLMRKFSNATGLELGDKMEEALSRMEAGDSSVDIEEDLDSIGENEFFRVKTQKGRKSPPPKKDETLYEM